MNTFLILIVSLVLGQSSAVVAAEKGQLLSLLTGYAELKQRVQEVREARKSGNASDSTMLMELFGEISEARQETFQFRAAQHTTGTMNKTDETTSCILYAYGVMGQIVSAEVDRNLYLPTSDISLRLADKYEEIWKIIDSAIPAVSLSS
jgi:hypothetical protein